MNKRNRLARLAQWLVGITACSMALPVVAEDGVDVDINGYYRVRGYYFQDVDLMADKVMRENCDPSQEDDCVLFGAGASAKAYTEQRLRFEPAIRVNENLGIFLSMDILDNVMGGHQAASPAPLFASTGSNHQSNMMETDSIAVKRAWVEYLIQGIGMLRFGRMPSHFGMGVFSNDGGNALGLQKKTLEEKWDSYFDEDFGDNNSGTTYDRVLFATKPLGPKRPLLVGIFWDHLAEVDINKGSDDVDEYGIVAYAKPDADPETGNIIQGGGYYINRRAYGTRSRINSASFHIKFKRRPLYGEAELVLLWGHAYRGGIPFSTSLDAKFGDITPIVARIGFDNDAMDARLEVGYAPGDKAMENTDRGGVPYRACNVEGDESCEMTTFNIHSGYRVGLLMFDQVLAQKMGASAFAKGAVINAMYAYPSFKYRLSEKKGEGLSFLAALLWGKAMESEQFRAQLDDETDLGFELDAGMQFYLNNNLRFDLQAGYLLPGKGYPVVEVDEDGDTLDPDPAWALISKFTVVF